MILAKFSTAPIEIHKAVFYQTLRYALMCQVSSAASATLVLLVTRKFSCSGSPSYPSPPVISLLFGFRQTIDQVGKRLTHYSGV